MKRARMTHETWLQFFERRMFALIDMANQALNEREMDVLRDIVKQRIDRLADAKLGE